MRRLAAIIASFFVVFGAWGHAGEDHGDAATAFNAPHLAPRAAAAGEEFELVAVLAGGKLTIYLDRAADNAPVPEAEIGIESGAFRSNAAQVAAGVYEAPGAAFAQPGRYPLTFTVQAGDSADLLAATLEIAAPAAPPARQALRWIPWTTGAAALAVALAAIVLFLRRRRGARPA